MTAGGGKVSPADRKSQMLMYKWVKTLHIAPSPPYTTWGNPILQGGLSLSSLRPTSQLALWKRRSEVETSQAGTLFGIWKRLSSMGSLHVSAEFISFSYVALSVNHTPPHLFALFMIFFYFPVLSLWALFEVNSELSVPESQFAVMAVWS